MKIYHVLIDKCNGCSVLSSVEVEKSFLTQEAAIEFIKNNPDIFDDVEYSIDYSYIDAELS